MDIKETIVRALSPGIKTPSGAGEFVIGQLEPTVVIEAGKSQQQVPITWEEFQAAADIVEQEAEILIETSKRAATPDSLQSRFDERGWTKRHANYVAAILKKAGIVDYHKRSNEGICVRWRS